MRSTAVYLKYLKLTLFVYYEAFCLSFLQIVWRLKGCNYTRVLYNMLE